MAIETPSAAFVLPSINGTATYTYPFNNSKFEDDDVFVYLYNTATGNYDLKSVTSDYAISGNTITFTSAPTTQVLILRRTDFNALKIPNFTPGSAIRGQDLDSNFTQLLRVNQEFRDLKVDKFFPEVRADLDMNSQRIESLADGATDTDAVNRGQLAKVITDDLVAGDCITLTDAAGGSNSGDQVTVKVTDNSITSAKIESSVLASHAAQVTAAANSATAAANSATAASTSQSAAATSATGSANSASAAATSATNAASSATSAASSATAAASSASAASTSSNSAATSATSAATSAAAAAAAFDNFDDTYLGQKASDPSTDNDGDALTAGDLYFNTTDDCMKVYIGSAWVTAYVPGDAVNISSTAVGNVAATNVQAAIQELDSEKLPITGYTGNVGIGTSSPAHELHIAGSGDTRALITSGGSGDAVMMFENASGNTWGHGLDLSSGNYVIGYNASGDPSLTAQGLLNIDSSGRVGVGTTAPNAELSVHSTSQNASVEITRGAVGSEYGYRLFGTNGATNSALTFFDVSNGSLGSERMRLDSSGKVGIGTSAPGSFSASASNLVVGDGGGNKGLSIFSSTTGTGNLYFADGTTGAQAYRGAIQYSHSSNSLAFYADAVERLRIDSSGRLMLGTTNAGVSAGLFNVAIDNTTFHLGYGANYDNYYSTGSSGEHIFRNGFTQSVKIDSSGKVGIGTTSPAELLHINSPSANAAQWITAGTGYTSTLNLKANGSGGGLSLSSATNGSASITNTLGSALTFGTNNTERMRINSAGNVGIGGAPNATFALDVAAGSIRAKGGGLFVSENYSATNNVFRIYDNSGQLAIESQIFGNANTNSAPIVFRTSTSSGRNERMRIDSSGNVGIGTSSPSSYEQSFNQFVIEKQGNAGITIATPTSGSNNFLGQIGFAKGTSGDNAYRGLIRYSHTDDAFSFFTAGLNERARIDASGNLLIGGTLPSAHNIVLAASGNIQTGSEPRAGANAGVHIGVNGEIQNTRSSGGNLFSGRALGSGMQTFTVTADGDISASGFIVAQDVIVSNGTSSGAYTFEGRLNNTSTSIIKADGSASFNGNISTVDNKKVILGSSGGETAIYRRTDGSAPGLYGKVAGTDKFVIQTNGNFLFGTSDPTTSPIVFGSTGSATFAGNVGIGTISPTKKLHVVGGNAGNCLIDNDGSQYTQLLFQRNGTDNSGGDVLIDGTAGNMQIRSLLAGPLVFKTSATAGSPAERLRIASSGNVTIGANLSLNTSNGDRNSLIVNNSSGNIGWRVYNDGSGNSTQFINNASGSAKITMVGSTGTGTFAGSIQSGGNPDSGTASGAKVFSEGAFIASKPSGGTIWAGFTNGNSSSTSSIRSDGSATFAGSIGVGASQATIRRNQVTGSFGLQLQGNANNTVSDTNPGAYINIGGGSLSDGFEGNIRLVAYGNTAGGNRNNILFSTRSGTNTIAERMRIDSSGNVGIGTSTPGQADGAGLTVRKYIDRNVTYYAPDGHYAGSFGETNDTQDKVWIAVDSSYYKSSAVSAGVFLSAFHADAGGSGCGSTIKNLKTDNALAFSTVATASSTGSPAVETERMRIDTSGNVGIGTSSPSGYNASANSLVIETNSGGTGLTISSLETNKVAATTSIFFADGTTGSQAHRGVVRYHHNDDSMQLWTSGSEKVRINSSGNVLVGTTTAFDTGTTISSGEYFARATSSRSLTLRRDSTDGSIAEFRRDANAVGTISVTTTATAYNTSSDYRLKENVVDIADGITRVKQLQPKRFNFIVDANTTVDGFIAHEAQTVVPEAVTGEKDGEEMQGIDQSKLVPLLTAALQEAIAKIETLETKVAALEAG